MEYIHASKNQLGFKQEKGHFLIDFQMEGDGVAK